MLSIRLLSLRRTLNFRQINGNFLRLNAKNGSIFVSKQWNRFVHSSNTHEIDFLFNKYKLTKISNGNQSYGQKSALHHFNVIEDFNLETDKDLVVETLKQLLDIRKTTANYLLKNYPNLAEMSAEKLEKQIAILSDKFSFTVDDYQSCPWILYLPINFITERLNPFGGKDMTKDNLVLLLLPMKTYENVLKKVKNKKLANIYEEFTQKSDLFCSHLNLISDEFCDLMHENPFLFHYDFERLQRVMDLVVNSGIQTDTILSDIRIFTHNMETMKKRIDICLKHNMPIKTWMLRSPEHPFNVSLKRHSDNKKVLKDYDNNIEFMANQLSCERDVIQSMMKRYPRIVRISAKKLSEMLTFLFDYGFTPFHIAQTPKILFHSVDTIVERIKELEKLKIKPNSLKLLTLSEKEYNKLLIHFK